MTVVYPTYSQMSFIYKKKKSWGKKSFLALKLYDAFNMQDGKGYVVQQRIILQVESVYYIHMCLNIYTHVSAYECVNVCV